MTGTPPKNHSICVESPWLFFNNLDWSSLTNGTEPAKVRKNTYLYHQNQPCSFVYIIKTGRVSLRIVNSEGKSKTLFFLCEGALFGEISRFTTPESCAESKTVCDSEIYMINHDKFKSVFKSDSTIAHNTAVVLSKKVRTLTSQMERMMMPVAAMRISDVLLYLVEQYGKPFNGGTLLTIRISHQELAELLGVSRITITNSLAKMMSDGIISKHRGHMLIHDAGQLLRFCRLNVQRP